MPRNTILLLGGPQRRTRSSHNMSPCGGTTRVCFERTNAQHLLPRSLSNNGCQTQHANDLRRELLNRLRKVKDDIHFLTLASCGTMGTLFAPLSRTRINVTSAHLLSGWFRVSLYELLLWRTLYKAPSSLLAWGMADEKHHCKTPFGWLKWTSLAN